MLVVTFGVNASGKDTLFKKLGQNVIYISASQVLMKCLGIIDLISSENPSRENYKSLENIDDNTRNIKMKIDFFEEIKNIEKQNQNKIIVIPMHLCIVKENNDSYTFDIPEFPDWFNQVNKFIYIRTPLLHLENRILKDIKEKKRQRLDGERESKIKQLILSEQKFLEIKNKYPTKCFSLANSDGKLENTLIKLENLLNLENISNVQHFKIH